MTNPPINPGSFDLSSRGYGDMERKVNRQIDRDKAMTLHNPLLN